MSTASTILEFIPLVLVLLWVAQYFSMYDSITSALNAKYFSFDPITEKEGEEKGKEIADKAERGVERNRKMAEIVVALNKKDYIPRQSITPLKIALVPKGGE